MPVLGAKSGRRFLAPACGLQHALQRPLLGCSPAVVAPWECIVLLNPQLADSYDTSAVSFWIKPKKEGLRASTGRNHVKRHPELPPLRHEELPPPSGS
ncbi:MAG: hypothetical protein E5X80_10530 [Mesorhizobium sp.]|nr:MAG: hypothetical protein E5X79_15400 [Mesorhizobium sp.]TJV65506.1 MAG: hypothetical protein E5X80_10530 [Mesorhizobium sp.]